MKDFCAKQNNTLEFSLNLKGTLNQPSTSYYWKMHTKNPVQLFKICACHC